MKFKMINIIKNLLIFYFRGLLVQIFILFSLKVTEDSEFYGFNVWHVWGGV